MPAVVPDHEKSPEHGTLRRPVSWPNKRALDREGSGCKACHDHHVPCEVGHRTEGVLLEALRGYRFANVRQGEGGLRSEVDIRFFRWLVHG